MNSMAKTLWTNQTLAPSETATETSDFDRCRAMCVIGHKQRRKSAIEPSNFFPSLTGYQRDIPAFLLHNVVRICIQTSLLNLQLLLPFFLFQTILFHSSVNANKQPLPHPILINWLDQIGVPTKQSFISVHKQLNSNYTLHLNLPPPKPHPAQSSPPPSEWSGTKTAPPPTAAS
jgi:hypothetical protein